MNDQAVIVSSDGHALATRELSPLVGTAIDADPETLLSGRFAQDLRALFDQRSVLVFPGVGFDDQQQIAFTRTLGIQAFENNGVAQANGEKQAIFKVSLDADRQSDRRVPSDFVLLAPRRLNARGSHPGVDSDRPTSAAGWRRHRVVQHLCRVRCPSRFR